MAGSYCDSQPSHPKNVQRVLISDHTTPSVPPPWVLIVDPEPDNGPPSRALYKQ